MTENERTEAPSLAELEGVINPSRHLALSIIGLYWLANSVIALGAIALLLLGEFCSPTFTLLVLPTVLLYGLWTLGLHWCSRVLRRNAAIELDLRGFEPKEHLTDCRSRLRIRADEKTMHAVMYARAALVEPMVFETRSWVSAAGALVCLYGSVVLTSRGIERAFPLVAGHGREIFVVVMLAGAVAGIVHAFHRRTRKHLVYRVVPGRIDEMQVDPHVNTLRTLRKLDLRRSRITCDAALMTLYLERGDEPADPVTIDLKRVDNPLLFVSSVFEAATTARVCPDLPDDDFLG